MLLTASAEPFALYSATWWAYIGCGIVFLGMIAWKVRRLRFSFQTAILTFFAAGAFSFTQVPDATTYAPAAIAMILELENEGSAGEIQMLSHIALVWFILMLLAGSARYGWLYYLQQQSTKSPSEQPSNQQATKRPANPSME